MDGTLISLLIVFGGWFPAGYLAARIINASSSDGNGVRWNWSRPVETELGRSMFGIGVLFGWTTAFFAACVFFVCLADIFARLAPSPKKPQQ